MPARCGHNGGLRCVSPSSVMAESSGRRRPRALQRHLIVGSVSAASVAVIVLVTERSRETWGSPDQLKSGGLLWQFNVATGTVALALIVATLSYRPVRTVRGRLRTPVHLPWRRTLGVWSVVLVAAHVPGGIAIHTTGWRFWIPFESVLPWADARPFDEFTVGYWMGLAALAALAPLAIPSNDASIRRLGPDRWRRLHRTLTWVAYWLIAVHVVTLQYGEFRNLRHVAFTATVFAVALAARALQLIVVHRRRAASTGA